MSRARMFLWIAGRSALLRGRRGRALTALIAVVAAAAVATAILSLSRDVQAKLRGELRSYGGNILVTAPEGASLPPHALSQIDLLLAGRGMAVPYAYAIARTSDDSPVVVVGTNFERARRLNSWWRVSNWPAQPKQALVGARAASAIASSAQPFELTFNRRALQVTPAGTLHTGGAEDSRIYLQLQELEAWTAVRASIIEISASLPPQQLRQFQQQLAAMLPSTQVREVRQITESEAKIFTKTRAALLVSVLLIILTSVLCVLANLTSSVLDRCKDFAVMKALGASESMTNGIFAAEAVLLGALGAVLGYLIGIGAAWWIGRVSLHQSVLPRPDVFPPILVASIALTLAASWFPIRMLRRIQPAAILKGE